MTGQTTEQITLDLDRDNFMSAEEALKYVNHARAMLCVQRYGYISVL